MTQDRRTRWLPVVVAVLALMPAGFLAAVLLFTACFVERDGTGDPQIRAQLCDAGGGTVLYVIQAVVVGAALVALVRAGRRAARASRACGCWPRCRPWASCSSPCSSACCRPAERRPPRVAFPR